MYLQTSEKQAAIEEKQESHEEGKTATNIAMDAHLQQINERLAAIEKKLETLMNMPHTEIDSTLAQPSQEENRTDQPKMDPRLIANADKFLNF